MARQSTKTDAQKAEALAAKGERFRKVAVARVSKALEAIESVANCANKNSYSYSVEQIDKMEAALRRAVDEAIAPFRSEGATVKKAIEL